MSAMVKHSKNYIFNMNKKEEETKQSKLKKSGKPLLKVKLKQELHICFLKTMLTLNQTNKIQELLKALIYAAKSLNTHQKKKLQFAIQLQFAFQNLQIAMVNSIMKNFTKFLEQLPETSTELLITIITQFLKQKFLILDIDQLVLVFKAQLML